MAPDGHSRAHLLQLSQKRCRPKSIGLSKIHRQVGGDRAALQPRAEEGVEDDLADAADLAQARQQQQRRLQHVAVEHRVHPRRIAQAADLLGDDAAEQREAQVGAHALRDRDPVVAAGAFHRLVALVEQQVDGVGVIRRQLVAAGIVRIPGPLGHGAQAHRVDTQVIRRRLQVVGIAPGVVRARRNRAAGVAELQQQQGAERAPRARADRALHHVVRVLRTVLHRLAQIAEQRAGEKVGALRKARHARGIDEGGRCIPPLQGLERERAVAELAAREGLAVEGAAQGAAPGAGAAQPPGRAVRLPAPLRRARCQRQVGGHREGRGHRRQAITMPDVGVVAIRADQPAGRRQLRQIDLAAGGAVCARGVSEHAQIARQQHRGLRRQHGRALGLRAGDPVAAGFVGPRFARVLDQDHHRVCMRRVVGGDRAVHHRGGLEHVGQDHVHAGGEAARLAGAQFSAQRHHLRVADRLGQDRLRGQCAATHHRRIEVVPGRLQVTRPLVRVDGHLPWHRVHRAVAHQVEHRDVTRHRMAQRLGIGVVERQRLHRRHSAEIGKGPLPAQPLEGERAQVDRAVTVRKQPHRRIVAAPPNGAA